MNNTDYKIYHLTSVILKINEFNKFLHIANIRVI